MFPRDRAGSFQKRLRGKGIQRVADVITGEEQLGVMSNPAPHGRQPWLRRLKLGQIGLDVARMSGRLKTGDAQRHLCQTAVAAANTGVAAIGAAMV